VVDDNEINRKVLARQLQSIPNAQLAVVTAANGADAVDVLMSQPGIALVIMDIEMPVMDGLEATQHIRRLEQQRGGPHVPIIGLSGNARQVCPRGPSLPPVGPLQRI